MNTSILKVLLKMWGYTGEIIFTDSGGKWDVKAIYGASEQAAGKYSVTINREDDNWYKIWGQGIYIKTSTCLSLALAKEAILLISAVATALYALKMKNAWSKVCIQGFNRKTPFVTINLII